MKPCIYYDSAFNDGAMVISSAAAGTAGDNVTDWRPYTWWRPTALPATLTVDCGSARACDYGLVWAHDLATQGATVEVRGSTDNFAASNVLVATSTPSSNAPVLLRFAAVSYRYWRLRITGTNMPSLAIAAIGSRFELPIGVSPDYDPTRRRVVAQTNRNANGQPLGKVIEYTEQTNRVTIRRVSWQWLRNTFLPAWRAHLRSTPFVFAWDGSADPTNLPLVVAGDDLSTPHYPGQTADVSFDITAAVD